MTGNQGELCWGGEGRAACEGKGLMEAVRFLRTWDWWSLAVLFLGQWRWLPVLLRPLPMAVGLPECHVGHEVELGLEERAFTLHLP